jgi:hypothetical protein
MLMGIAAKNSILLVEYAIMAMKERHEPARGDHRRLLTSGPGRSS